MDDKGTQTPEELLLQHIGGLGKLCGLDAQADPLILIAMELSAIRRVLYARLMHERCQFWRRAGNAVQEATADGNYNAAILGYQAVVRDMAAYAESFVESAKDDED